ncbi:hypothetical protein C8F04DRAFT_1045592 [Mycena alexandri]|uniref:DUF5648 domain-containing protein n=1 Tax=Mycena alexandri TaxID=1745969 RepID=A0AAD6SFX7_9AGAR|nr:hypothetical protein C8F04DRAFT_1045592 [Mycena alexandri]
MKSSFTVTFSSALLLAFCASSSALAPAKNVTATAPSPLTCGDPSDAVPLYFMEIAGQDMYYATGIGFVTTLVGDLAYTFLGIAARVFTTQELSTVPFFHLQNDQTSDNFYTISATDRELALETGWGDAGIAAYIYPSQICGSVPLYGLYQSVDTIHFYTINETTYDAMLAGTGGWADQGIAGYVLDLNPCAAE